MSSSRQQAKRRHRDAEQGWRSDDDEYDYSGNQQSAGAGSHATESESEPVSKLSTQDQDLIDRLAFEERLRARDSAATRSTGESERDRRDREAAQERDLIARLEADERRQVLERSRQISRSSYLEKRVSDKLAEAEALARAERLLFRDQDLTERELRQRELRERTFRTASEHHERVDAVETGYVLPDETTYEPEKDLKRARKKEAEQFRRYTSTEKGDTGRSAWEDEQIGKGQLRFGAGAGRAGPGSSGPAGLLMLDDLLQGEDIEFVLDQVAGGTPAAEKLTPAEIAAQEERHRARTIREQRESLPAFEYREEFLRVMEQNQVVVLVGETGSGKTTQIPQFLHEAGYTRRGRIGCTQPRRVAAMSVAKRVSEEMGTRLGQEVGYSIRFEDCTSDRTVIKYMTDGMLLREFMTEPDLKSYSVMIIDEAHERTLHTDILFGLVKDIARYRPDLKLVIMSATMDADKFSRFFDDALIFKMHGRRFPVDIYYTKSPEADYLDACVVTTLQIHLTQGRGDILVFLTGQEEIETVQENLQKRMKALGPKAPELIICPIYANLPSDMQNKIFEPTPAGSRKVVLATNIAETSITIDGIVFVIDPGFSKLNSYNPRTGMSSLLVTPCSRAMVNQRAGRAGRVGPGKCFRLYTRWSYEHELEENTVPEIQRTNLGNVVLLLKSLGIDDLVNFDFLDPPTPETLIRALEQVRASPVPSRHLHFPLAQLIVTICAMLSVNSSVFYAPKDRKSESENARLALTRPHGDHMTLLNVWNSWVETNYSVQWCFENFIQYRSMNHARDVRDQLLKLLERVEIKLVSNEEDDIAIRKAITAGFFYHAAQKNISGKDFRTSKSNQTVLIHPSSTLHKTPVEWVVYHELMLTSREFMRQVTEIDPTWLVEVAPHYYSGSDITGSETSGKGFHGEKRHKSSGSALR
ncbi:adenosinetriphosphatase [Fonticula alba]|uniref:RNA helicase n=1 Tax=Fonticula alba TaxID=691883 RepID=A0A058Z5E6_FONAL|nr:adenosinetriphosphatase [Fonticula alba]KCV69479.1 adenosinetriphosphatase [Fonticula alba]|eukprot:XP_009496044.1 adenosinetriphosphatase [Fonticula alba]